MTEDEPLELKEVAAAFAADPPDRDDDVRVLRTMQRIRSEVASREVLLFVFVRIWLTALELGAAVCTRDPRSKRS